jgi:hypothetical protein
MPWEWDTTEQKPNEREHRENPVWRSFRRHCGKKNWAVSSRIGGYDSESTRRWNSAERTTGNFVDRPDYKSKCSESPSLYAYWAFPLSLMRDTRPNPNLDVSLFSSQNGNDKQPTTDIQIGTLPCDHRNRIGHLHIRSDHLNVLSEFPNDNRARTRKQGLQGGALVKCSLVLPMGWCCCVSHMGWLPSTEKLLKQNKI